MLYILDKDQVKRVSQLNDSYFEQINTLTARQMELTTRLRAASGTERERINEQLAIQRREDVVKRQEYSAKYEVSLRRILNEMQLSVLEERKKYGLDIRLQTDRDQERIDAYEERLARDAEREVAIQGDKEVERERLKQDLKQRQKEQEGGH